MWRKTIPTNYWLWATLLAVLFVIFASINWVPEGKAVSYFGTWYIYLDHGGFNSANGDFHFALIFGGLLHAIPAVALGWVCQAIIMTVQTRKHFRRVLETPSDC